MFQAANHFYQFGEFIVDEEQKVLLCNGSPLPLTPKIFDTLLILVENGGRIVGKQDLMNRLWPDTFVEDGNLTFNIQQLRKSLGDDARKPRFIETVSRRGYRFIAPVEELTGHDKNTKRPRNGVAAESHDRGLTGTADDVESTGVGEPANVEEITGRSLNTRRKAFVAAGSVAVVLAAAIGGWLLWSRASSRTQASTKRSMLAVLPFQNLTGDASQDYFSDGLTEEMITQLGNLDPQHLGVIARTSVMHYKNSQERLDQIGSELGVQYVLEGSVRRESDKVRITAQLIQIKDQTHLWSREYDRELKHLLVLQQEIAQEVADEIRPTLGNTRKIAGTVHQISLSPSSYEAYDLYLKGQYFFNQRNVAGFEQAIKNFQDATTKDPNYARAYAGLADCYALKGEYLLRPQTEFMQNARDAAQRAVELDDNLAEAHTALALIKQNFDRDWQTSEKEFQRAIDLNPNYATAHHWYAEHLAWQGHFNEALRESERARQLDPLSLIIRADNGAILYYARQYDDAIAQFRAVREMDPNFPRSGLIRFAYVQKGLFSSSLDEIETWRRTYGDQAWTWSELAYVYGKSGQLEKAKHALQKLLEWDRKRPVDPLAITWAYLGTGNNDEAITYLEKAYSEHSNSLTTLKVEPGFDDLRNNPRYQDLERQVGLTQ